MPNFVDIWLIPLDLDLPETLPLSADEWQRARRMLPAPRQTFLSSHSALRRILAAYVSVRPEQIAFQVDAYGKPSLIGASELHFNLSHSEALALCAVTQRRQIGVDLEFARPIPEMDAIAASHFAPEEYRQFSALPADQQRDGFYALWTRKEAFVKALGQGLSWPLDRFRVPLEQAAVDQRLPILDSLNGAALDWSLYAFCPAPGCAAACVIAGEAAPPTLRRFPAEFQPKGVSRP